MDRASKSATFFSGGEVAFVDVVALCMGVSRRDCAEARAGGFLPGADSVAMQHG